MTNTETTTRPNENTITRRTMLKNLAVASASVTLVGGQDAGASEPLSAGSDAELIGLGGQYARLNEQNRALLKDMNPLQEKWANEIERRNIDWSDVSALRRVEDEMGLSPMQDLNEFLCDQMGEIEMRVRDLHPTTIEGVRAKLIIAWGTFGPKYNDEKPREEQEWHILLMNELFDDLNRPGSTA
jgi:hypothetical protein